MTLSDVFYEAKSTYEQTGKNIPFPDALYQAVLNGAGAQENKEQEAAPDGKEQRAFIRRERLLSDEELFDQLFMLPVDPERVLKTGVEAYIREDSIFPEDKDIFVTVFVPYTRDHMHFHDYFEIVYVYKGSCSMTAGEQDYTLQEGSLVFLKPETPHYFSVGDMSIVLSVIVRKKVFSTESSSNLLNNDIIGRFIKRAYYDRRSENILCLEMSKSERTDSLVQMLIEEVYAGDVYSKVVVDHLLIVLFTSAARAYRGTEEKESSMISLAAYNKDFPKILNYVQQNPETVTLAGLSEIFHYSEVYISKLFKKTLNNNFSKILQDLKLYKGSVLLSESDCSVHEISDMIGYSSAEYFARAFKQKYKMTPSEYRERHFFHSAE